MSCRDIATVLSTDGIEGRSWLRRVQVGLHLAMCRHCRRFHRLLRGLDLGARVAREAWEREPEANFEDRIASAVTRRAGLAGCADREKP